MNTSTQEPAGGHAHLLFAQEDVDLTSLAASSSGPAVSSAASPVKPDPMNGVSVFSGGTSLVASGMCRYVGALSVAIVLHGILFLLALQESRNSSVVAPPPIRITLLTALNATEKGATASSSDSSQRQAKPVEELTSHSLSIAEKRTQRSEQGRQRHKKKTRRQASVQTTLSRPESNKFSMPSPPSHFSNEEQAASITENPSHSVMSAGDLHGETELEPMSEQGTNISVPSQGDDEATTPVPASQAATPPVLITHVSPRYPERARLLGIEGLVRLEAILDNKGRVEENVKILESIPLLDEAASAAVRQWRFRPARDRQGRPIRVILEVPLRFVLN